MVRLDAMTINQSIEITIFAVATMTMAVSIADTDHEEKKRTAGHEIA